MTDSRLPMNAAALVSQFDPQSGHVHGARQIERRLSELAGYFADEAAYARRLAEKDSLLYTVVAVEPESGPGALHYAIARLMPGRIGQEYFLTKGHFHAWRAAAEYYIGLSGHGLMLLENEEGTDSYTVPLRPNAAVYVPGHTAHRTINTGDEPLVYLGIYPAQAGHDYGAIAERNFHSVVVDVDGVPTHMSRAAFLGQLASPPKDTDD